MNVAFDIDGVMTDIEKFQLECGAKFFKEKYNMEIVNRNGYSIKEIFECTDEQEYEFWKKNIINYALKYPIRVGCAEMIKKIIDDGNKLFIISSRIKCKDSDLIGCLMRILVKRFLWLEGIKYENIEFCSTNNSAADKVEACIKNDIDVMVEDSPENIEELKKVTKVICFDASYNRHISSGIIRTKNFYEIYDVINRMNPNNFSYLKREEREKLNRSELIEYYKKLKEYYIKNTDQKKIRDTEKFYRSIIPMLKFWFDLKYPHEVENINNLPEKNTSLGTIYVANHRDMIDPPLIMSLLNGKPVHLLLKAEFLENKIVGKFLKSLGCIFVNRENKDSQILSREQMIKTILNGSDVIIFPEGTRNKTDKKLLNFKLGAVYTAQVTGAPIVPIAITKKFNDYKEKIVLKVGETMRVEYFDDIVLKNEELKENISQLLENNESCKIKIK